MSEREKIGILDKSYNSSWTKENGQLEKAPSTGQRKSEINTVQRKESNPNSLSYGSVMQLQNIMGNRAITQLLKNMANQNDDSNIIQKKGTLESERESVVQSKKELQSSEKIQKKEENNTGMSDNLKAGVENLSGLSMDDVRVHYNSDKPQKLGALAYTQGTDIHVGAGQEKHLPHEAWHVVQQKLGRVQPTMQLKGINVNDDTGLEKEADEMGSKIGRLKMLENKSKLNIVCMQEKTIQKKLPDIQQIDTSEELVHGTTTNEFATGIDKFGMGSSSFPKKPSPPAWLAYNNEKGQELATKASERYITTDHGKVFLHIYKPNQKIDICTWDCWSVGSSGDIHFDDNKPKEGLTTDEGMERYGKRLEEEFCYAVPWIKTMLKSKNIDVTDIMQKLASEKVKEKMMKKGGEIRPTEDMISKILEENGVPAAFVIHEIFERVPFGKAEETTTQLDGYSLNHDLVEKEPEIVLFESGLNKLEFKSTIEKDVDNQDFIF